MNSKKPRLDRDDAETLALQGLAFLAADSTRLTRFLSLTGIGPAELRTAAATNRIQAAVLDHFLEDESLLLVFASEAGIEPGVFAPARRLLSAP